MLALSRKAGQSIVIGDQIEITIVEIRGDQVRVAIKAPKEISIYRKEIYTAIQTENLAAADSLKDSLDGMADIIAQAIKVKK